jgi:glutaminyl-peptide cyclotransferase
VDTDVLNGIALHQDTGDVWVTGKRWPWLYKITLESR